MTRIILSLLTLLLVMSAPARADTFVTNEQANKYYAGCVTSSAKSETRFSPEAQKMFCACTAARMTQGFTMDDMKMMTDTANPNSRIALNKMIVNIYAPCMEEPTREYHYSTCIANPQVARLGKDPQFLCKCAADEIAEHMRIHGAEQFKQILARNPTIEDPMQALYDDPKFQSFTQSKLLGCLK